MDRSSSAFTAITKSEERAGKKLSEMAMAIHRRSSSQVFLCFSKRGAESVARKKPSKSKVGWSRDCLSFLATFSYLSPLDEVRDHHNGPDPLLPHHPPERVEGVCERTLSANIRPCFLKPINEVGIEVLSALLARKWAKLDAGVII